MSASHLLLAVAVALACGLFTVGAMHCALMPWRRSCGSHWTERARLSWAARRTLIWIALASGFCGSTILTHFHVSMPMYLNLPAFVSGVLLGSYPAAHELEPRYTFGIWLGQTAWMLGYYCGFLGIGACLAVTMPAEMTTGAWVRAGLGLIGAALVISGVWLPLVVRTRHTDPTLVEMKQRLEEIVARATAATGIRPRHVWLLPTPLPNAVALPFIHGVAFTSRSMEILDDEECLAVMLHEFGHLRESAGVLALRILGSMSLFVFVFARPMIHWLGPLAPMLLLVVYLVMTRVTQLLGRRMEQRADRAAVADTRHAPVYARALEKLHEAGQIPAVMAGKRMVHPHLYDRMLAAGVTPAYPRPAPPARITWVGWVCVAVAVFALVALR